MNSAYTLKQKNIQAFMEHLTLEYTELFKNDPDYSYSAFKISPIDLARKMTLGLDSGSANKDGKGIFNTCKFFGIKYTYKAIREFLNKE